jgi:hypothetical protein
MQNVPGLSKKITRPLNFFLAALGVADLSLAGFDLYKANHASPSSSPSIAEKSYETDELGLSYYYDTLLEGYVIFAYTGSSQVLHFPSTHNALPVVAVAPEAFKSNALLTECYLSNTIRELGKHCFAGCNNLRKFQMSSAIEHVGFGCFDGCDSLVYSQEKVSDGTKESTIDYLGGSEGSEHYYLASCEDKTITSFTMHLGFRVIGYGAFVNCTALTSVDITDLYGGGSCQEIGDSAFDNCPALTSFKGEIVRIGRSSFSGDYKLSVASDFLRFTTSIGDVAFEICSSLQGLTFPSTITSIGFNAFIGTNVSYTESDGLRYYDSSLAYANGPTSTVPSTITFNNATVLAQDSAFSGKLEIEKVVLPASSTFSLGTSCFRYCRNLREVENLGLLQNLPAGCFSDCPQLALPRFEHALSIGNLAFDGNTSLGSYFYLDSGLKYLDFTAYTPATEEGGYYCYDGSPVDFLNNVTFVSGSGHPYGALDHIAFKKTGSSSSSEYHWWHFNSKDEIVIDQ